jgi:hypothetical protein
VETEERLNRDGPAERYRFMPDRKPYFHALAKELDALKDRVRQLKQHWPTDGEWKESVLRTVLRRHLPGDVSVGRGFVVSAEHESSQLDILIHDASRPVLFRDGDLVIVTPDAVLGVIEVKTSVTVAEFRDAVAKLKQDISVVRRHPHRAMRNTVNAFAAVFAYQCNAPDCEIPFLETVVSAADERSRTNRLRGCRTDNLPALLGHRPERTADLPSNVPRRTLRQLGTSTVCRTWRSGTSFTTWSKLFARTQCCPTTKCGFQSRGRKVR